MQNYCIRTDNHSGLNLTYASIDSLSNGYTNGTAEEPVRAELEGDSQIQTSARPYLRKPNVPVVVAMSLIGIAACSPISGV